MNHRRLTFLRTISTICAGLACTVAGVSRADVPRLIHHQGKLRTAGGSAVNGDVSLQIRLYGDETQPTPLLFDESHATVAVTNGLFSILIGSLSGGVPDSALDAGEVWMGVTVNGGDELMPRVRVGMTAYAAKSHSSEQLVKPGTMEAAATVDGDGNVGIGTSSPGARLEVAGNLKITGGSPGAGKVLTSDDNGLAGWAPPESVPTTGVILWPSLTPPVGYTSLGDTPSVTINFGDMWATKAGTTFPHAALATAVYNNIIYVIGGGFAGTYMEKHEAYDPITNTWSNKADLPTPRGGVRGAAAQGKIYVMGGNWQACGGSTSDVTEAYDPVTNTWATMAPMPTARTYLTVTAAPDGLIYAIGGNTGPCCCFTGTNEAYNPVTNTWVSKPAMPTARSAHAAALVGNKIYVMGGQDCGNCMLATTEAYDTVAQTWTTLASMPSPRTTFSAAVVNDVIYTFGGNDGSNHLDVNIAYSPSTNQWTSKTNLPAARDNSGAAAVNGVIYVVAGHNASGPMTESAAYTPPAGPPMTLYYIQKN